MVVKIRTIKDIKHFMDYELSELYSGPEISAFANIIKTELKLSKLQMIAFPESAVTGKQAGEIVRICRELKTGRPIQYILGKTGFYNCIIGVNSSTLIPRPETEELVDLIIKDNNGFIGSIVDLGTGSGCIAIALGRNIPGARVTGIDSSGAAIETAIENAVINKVNITFLISDIFDLKKDQRLKADIIVSNPPYVRESEKKEMAKNVIDFEPAGALFVPDSDPLKYYSAILGIARIILAANGRIYFEINEAFGKEIAALLDSAGFTDISIIKDLNGKDRFAKGIRNG